MKPEPGTIDGWLLRMRTNGLDRLDAQLLIAHVLGTSREWVLSHSDRMLDRKQQQQLESLMQRRSDREPLAYLTGRKEFHGLELQVSAAVLVPRPDTETLVEWALALLRGSLAKRSTPRVLDLGTGSGAMALAINKDLPQCRVTASDSSPRALAIARANAERLSLPVEFVRSDWWSNLQGEKFDLVLSNPPYLSETDPHLGDLRHEPPQALVSGPDGYEAIREIVREAKAHMRPGAWLLLEHGCDQADEVRNLLRKHGFRDIETRSDLAGLERCSGARL